VVIDISAIGIDYRYVIVQPVFDILQNLCLLAIKSYFYTYQIVVMCSIQVGRRLCDIHSVSRCWHWLGYIETIQTLVKLQISSFVVVKSSKSWFWLVSNYLRLSTANFWQNFSGWAIIP